MATEPFGGAEGGTAGDRTAGDGAAGDGTAGDGTAGDGTAGDSFGLDDGSLSFGFDGTGRRLQTLPPLAHMVPEMHSVPICVSVTAVAVASQSSFNVTHRYIALGKDDDEYDLFLTLRDVEGLPINHASTAHGAEPTVMILKDGVVQADFTSRRIEASFVQPGENNYVVAMRGTPGVLGEFTLRATVMGSLVQNEVALPHDCWASLGTVACHEIDSPDQRFDSKDRLKAGCIIWLCLGGLPAWCTIAWLLRGLLRRWLQSGPKHGALFSDRKTDPVELLKVEL